MDFSKCRVWLYFYAVSGEKSLLGCINSDMSNGRLEKVRLAFGLILSMALQDMVRVFRFSLLGFVRAKTGRQWCPFFVLTVN